MVEDAFRSAMIGAALLMSCGTPSRSRPQHSPAPPPTAQPAKPHTTQTTTAKAVCPTVAIPTAVATALAATPPAAATIHRLADAYAQRGDVEKAGATLVRLLNKAPDDTKTMRKLMVLYKDSGCYDRAIAMLSRLREHEPGREREHLNALAKLHTDKRVRDGRCCDW